MPQETATQISQTSGGSRNIRAPPIGGEVNNLPVQVSLVVPSTQGDEKMVPARFKDRVVRVREWFDARFGGDTTLRGSGGYLGENELITEDVAIVESSMSIETYRDERDNFADYVKIRREAWDQDTIAYKVEGRLFIYPQRDYIDDSEAIPDEIVRVV